MKNIFENIRENKGVIFIHLVVWLMYMTYIFLVSHYDYEYFGGVWKTALAVLMNHTFCAVTFYSLSLYVYPCFTYQTYRRFFRLFLLTIIPCGLLRYLINYHVFPLLGIANRYTQASNSFSLDTVWILGLWSIYSLGYYYFRKSIQHEKDLRLLQESQSAAEMSFLTSQINPHFLYNTLNFFYAEALPVLPNLSKGIMLLSDMMRYAINNDDAEGKVPLENEVKHIKNFIEINQLRYGNRLQVHFEQIGVMEYRRIMPLILITFVENAFKHGELLSPENPLEISLNVAENHLIFQLKNLVRKGPKEQSEGIGLVNTRRRLAIAYPERHTLRVSEEGGFYAIFLRMDL